MAEVPPRTDAFSSTSTRAPPTEAVRAAERAAEPDPMTTTSAASSHSAGGCMVAEVMGSLRLSSAARLDEADRAASCSVHFEFRHRLVIADALVTERAEVEGFVCAEANEFRDGTAGGGAVLHAVAGEAGGDNQIGEFRMKANDGVMVEQAHVVVAGPGAGHAQLLERRNAMGELRPDVFLEQVEVGVEVLAGVGVVFGQW